MYTLPIPNVPPLTLEWGVPHPARTAVPWGRPQPQQKPNSCHRGTAPDCKVRGQRSRVTRVTVTYLFDEALQHFGTTLSLLMLAIACVFCCVIGQHIMQLLCGPEWCVLQTVLEQVKILTYITCSLSVHCNAEALLSLFLHVCTCVCLRIILLQYVTIYNCYH